MKAAQRLGSSGSIYPLTYATIFGLITSTGMRVSGVLAPRLLDVIDDGLIIAHTKFKKSRLLLPLSDGGDNLLSTSTVGNVGCGQVQHQKSAFHIHRNMSLPSFDLLPSPIATAFGRRWLDRLAAHNCGCGALLPSFPLAVEHQGNVTNCAEHKQPDETPNHQSTVCHGGKSCGSICQLPPVRAR